METNKETQTLNHNTFTLPLEMKWKPKQDITTYELAFCMKYLCRTSSVMPYEVNMSDKYLRHFEITDRNKYS